MKTKRLSFLARAAMTLLLAVLTATTAWADSWPEYITDVVLAGGTASEVASVKNSSTYSGYTWCSTSLNEGTSGDIIYIGYKKSSNPAYINGGYITDFVVVETGSSHNPSSTFSLNGITYYLCPYAGGNTFANDRHGNLTSQVSKAKNLYLYYTKANFSNKRAVSDITITTGSSESSASKSGAINCYNTNGTLFEAEIDLNKGAGCGTYVYMHLTTVTKTNRPSVDPVMASGLVYNGSEQMLVASMGTTYDNTYKMWFREIDHNQYFYENTAQFTKATDAGTYNVEYYAGSSTYGDKSETKIHQVTIAKSANNGVTVSCADIVDGNAPAPQLGGNLSTGAVTYQYCTTQNGTYTTTVPTDFGKYWVKATIAADGNCNAFTTAAASFYILADANDLWNVKGGANGTVDHPFIISTPSQLDLLAKKVNGTDGYTANDFSGKHFRLEADIAYDHTGLGDTESNYEAIGCNDGTNNRYFRGTFDGANHTVSGIRIYKNGTANDDANQGLFGRIGSPAEVKSVILADARITGCNSTGAIVGYNNEGTVTDCHALADVTVHAVQSGAYYHGGIAGSNWGTITGCTSAAALTTACSDSRYVGGIAGYNSGTIRDCLIYGGSVSGTSNVGAVVGYNSGTLTNNHYSGVTLNGSEALRNAGVGYGSQDGTSYICAVIPYEGVTLSIPSVSATTEYPYNGLKIYPTGMTYKGQYYNYISNDDAGISGDVTFTATYSGSVPKDCALGGFGSTSIADATDVAMDWAATGSSATCTLCTGNAAIYYIAPTFRYVSWGDGDGTAADPYLIYNKDQLDLLAHRVNGTHGETANDYSGKHFRLEADIAYDHTGLGDTESNYEAIGCNDGTYNRYFRGTFDGANHTVSGIRIYKGGTTIVDKYQGLFGQIGNGAEVKNVILADARITAHDQTGAIVGYNDKGTVTDCHALATVTVHTVQSGVWNHGGIAGHNNTGGTVTGCTSAAALTTAGSNSYYVGGIAGNNYGTVTHCIYLGTTLDGASCVGAIVGKNHDTVETSYYTDNAASAVGYNDNGTVAATVGLALRDDADNTGFLTLMAARTEALAAVTRTPALTTAATLTLHGRTLYKDGAWNTICLPFNVTIAGSVLDGADARELIPSTSKLEGTTLTLNFTPVTEFVAGTPYIIKWDDGDNIVNPVFTGVTITSTTPSDYNFTGGKFVGSYSPVDFTADDRSILYLGGANQLHWPNADMTLGACRAHFELSDGEGASEILLNFDGEETTSLREKGIVNSEKFAAAAEWYTLDGRRLSQKPTQKGLYIHNGRKEVLK